MTFQNVRKILRTHNLCDWFFCNRFSTSPYRACGHGCSYCDGRAEKYYVEGDFETSIVVRQNFLDLLPVELDRIRERGMISFGSGVTDVYQPVEDELKIMRKSAAILLHYQLPVLVVTKSSLILRDLDIWAEKNKRDGFVLMVSLATLREDIRKAFEKGASPVGERLETVRRFKEAGCTVGVLAMPMLPYLTDSEDDFRNLCSAAKKCGADFVIPGNLTLRPGRQKECYLETLKEFEPGIIGETMDLYCEERLSGNTVKSYQTWFMDTHIKVLDELEIPGFMPHKHVRRIASLCDETFILMQHLSFLYGNSSSAAGRLKKTISRYAEWLSSERKNFNKRRSLDSRYLDDLLIEKTENGDFSKILENEKLADFLKNSILHGQIFDYLKKEWIP